MEEKSARSPLDGETPMRPSVAEAVKEMRGRAPVMSAKGIFHHPSECTPEEENFIADCLKRNIPLYVIAGMIHCERSFLSRYIKSHPELLELKEEQMENIVDEAEYQLDRLNRAGNPSTIIFTLQTRGRKRGWTTEDVSGGGEGDDDRIVMGIIPEKEVKEAEAEVEKVRGSMPGGVLTDPASLAAMETEREAMKEAVRAEVRAEIAAETPKPIEAEAVEVGMPPYGDGGYGGGNAEDPWGAGADSPFAM